jgi:hypothetical protein
VEGGMNPLDPAALDELTFLEAGERLAAAAEHLTERARRVALSRGRDGRRMGSTARRNLILVADNLERASEAIRQLAAENAALDTWIEDGQRANEAALAALKGEA